MKTKLAEIKMGLGRVAFVEQTAYGAVVAKADFHPDDPIHTLKVGTARECYRAIHTTARAIKNNFLGRVTFKKSRG
jgi:hypothetical protein